MHFPRRPLPEQRFQDQKRVHRPTELLLSLVAFALLAAMSMVVAQGEPPLWEVQAFRSINQLPDWLFYFIWPFMQYGVFITIPVVAVIAIYLRRYRLAVLLLAGGIGIYYLALVVKGLVPRGRPGELLEMVREREIFAAGSKGFTSGHTAVASTIATFAHHYLSRRWQQISLFTLAVVIFGRVYIGGHLPLDVLGGVCLGVGVASLVNFVVGVPVKPPTHVEETKSWIRHHRPRHPGDIIRLGIAAIAFGITTLAALSGQISGLEESVFRTFNALPDFLSPVLQFIMQAGALYFVFIAGGAALLFKHKRLALKTVFGGVLVWWLAKLAKFLVDRDRPFYLLGDITQRATNSGLLGFPSGHAAVTALLATVTSPYLPRPWRRVIWLTAWVVGLSRMYVGAHFPLDIFAGLAMGWFFGSALNLLFGTPAKVLPIKLIKEKLRQGGVTSSIIDEAMVDARGSMPLYARTSKGAEVFIKLIDTEQRNADILYRLWRHLSLRKVEDDTPFTSAKQAIEHEAYVSIQARLAGVRTPEIVLATPISKSSAMLVTKKIEGKTLNNYQGIMTDRLLENVWKEIAKLHKKRIAHRDLRAANVLIDTGNRPWLIDFSFSSTAASDTQLKEDIVEHVASLALICNPEQAVRTAIKILGKNRIKETLPYLQLPLLTSATKKGFKARPGLMEELRTAVQEQTNSRPVPPARISRINYQWLWLLVILALTIFYVFPRIGELDNTWRLIQSTDILWLLAALLGYICTFLMASIALTGATSHPLHFRRIAIVQLAMSAVNRITPKGIGGIVLMERYLEKSHLRRAEATAAVSMLYATGVAVHITLLFFAVLLVRPKEIDFVDLTPTQLILIAIVLGFLSLGLLLMPRLMRSVKQWAREIRSGISRLRSSPSSALRLLGGTAGVTLAYTFALYYSLEALGPSVPFMTVLLAYLAGSALASASPTPGGLGAIEASLAVGLSILQVPIDQAIAGVLVFRLITFWLPIIPGLIAFRYAVRHKLF